MDQPLLQQGWKLEIARDRLPRGIGAPLSSSLWGLADTGLRVLHVGAVVWRTEITFCYALIGASMYLHPALNGTTLGFCPLQGGNFESEWFLS